jgi:hypothetical protein
MADIRSALRDRLKSINAEIAELVRRQEQLVRHQKTIEAALIQEESLLVGSDRLSDDDGDEEADFVTRNTRLSELLADVLKDGPKTLEELKLAGAPWFSGTAVKSPGRAINFALVGMAKGNRVRRLNNGAWELVSGGGRK